MKKLLISVIVAIFSVLGCIFAASCKDGVSENKDGGVYYNVEVNDKGRFLSEPLKDKYKAGDEIEVKLPVILDEDLYVFVNDKKISKSHYDSDYWGYKFTMPEEDIVIFITMNENHGAEIQP